MKEIEIASNHRTELYTLVEGVKVLVDDVSGKGEKPGRRWAVTERETSVFDTRNYRNSLGGFLAASTTIVGLLGLGVWLKNRKAQSAATLISRSTANYASMDRRIGSVPSLRAPKKQPSKKLAESIEENDTEAEWGTVINQVQLIGAVAVSIVVGVTSSWMFVPIQDQLRDSAKLPLQPGRSPLFDKICPEAVEAYQKTIQSSTASRHWLDQQMKTQLVETVELMSSPELLAKMPTDQELWNDPRTPSLQAMKHLVINCQQRIQYIKDLKEKQDRKEGSADDTDGPFDIPEPGVPPMYLGIDVEAEISSEKKG